MEDNKSEYPDTSKSLVFSIVFMLAYIMILIIILGVFFELPF